MSAFATHTMLGSVALFCLSVGLWALLRPRVSFRAKSQSMGRVHVFDGAADLSTRGDEGSSYSCYVCYIRRAREKTSQLPTVQA